MIHRDEEVFPDPMTFDPTRWINDPPEVIQTREKFLVSFSRGNRMCIGQNLAMCELYITFATLFRRFEHLRTPYIGPFVYVDYFVVHHPDHFQKLKVYGPEQAI
jgi:cytochrome P450